MSQNLDFFKAKKRLRSPIVTVNFFWSCWHVRWIKLVGLKLNLQNPNALLEASHYGIKSWSNLCCIDILGLCKFSSV